MASLRKYMQTEVNYSYEEFEDNATEGEEVTADQLDNIDVSAVAEGLEAYQSLLRDSKTLTNREAQSVLIGVRMIQKQIGFEEYRCVSTEDYRHNTPREMLRVSMEAVEEAKKGMWQKIKDFFAKIWNWVKNLFSKIGKYIADLAILARDLATVKGDVEVREFKSQYIQSFDFFNNPSILEKDIEKVTSYCSTISLAVNKTKDIISSSSDGDDIDEIYDYVKRAGERLLFLRAINGIIINSTTMSYTKRDAVTHKNINIDGKTAAIFKRGIKDLDKAANKALSVSEKSFKELENLLKKNPSDIGPTLASSVNKLISLSAVAANLLSGFMSDLSRFGREAVAQYRADKKASKE